MEILIVTYLKDLPFLQYNLRGMARFARGFQACTIVVPNHELTVFENDPALKTARDQIPFPVRVCGYDELPGKGMLHHLVQKMRADEWCPHASHILHLDADCLFWEPATPADFLDADGRPEILAERYRDVRNPVRLCWWQNVQRAIGDVPEYETMVRHPHVYQRDLYRYARSLIRRHTLKFWDDYILDGRNEFPQTFAEFPLLGHLALRDDAESYSLRLYDWKKDALDAGLPADTPFQYLYKPGRDKVVECWSHGGIEGYRQALEAWVQGENRPAYFLKP